jgi:hypothetical protein
MNEAPKPNGYRLALELLKRLAAQQVAYDPRSSRDSLILHLLAGSEVDDALAYLGRLGIEPAVVHEIHFTAATFQGTARARYFHLLHWLSRRADAFDSVDERSA